MAHLLPPAGITYPESERFRNYLVRPPASQEKSSKVVICCERTPSAGPGCRGNIQCRVIDGDKSFPIKVCPDFADTVTGFCEVNDCTPRPPLTQPGTLCYSGCVDSCPQQAPRPCRSATCCKPCCKPCATIPPCGKPNPAATYCNPCPTPCPNPWRRPQTQRVCSATCRNRPRLVKETVTSHVYTYQY